MKPNIDMLDRSQCVFRIPRECGREFICETGGVFVIRIR